MSYLKRDAAESVSYLLKHFPAVVALGARQVGKSTLIRQVLPNAAFFDLIVETDAGLIPIDIKAGSVTRRKQIVALEAFVKEHQCRFGVVVNNGDSIYKLSDSIYRLFFYNESELTSGRDNERNFVIPPYCDLSTAHSR